ncbi:RAN GTPase-activating protein 1 [Hondaea fermentalgiana]|uniref:RAN GTPase-activating protein 1 n=1 Tax=Hondaea fermentalgiana TaxID=2315210 RepID=A0A2R5GAD0_9STRA|nr:RAN GTPase-activating protein 1 [Hondaea fermentalgiana]|eukprot:GBG27249.1 RAN GTPase-activating protein 1 [Hondaea fermentalgiana]
MSDRVRALQQRVVQLEREGADKDARIEALRRKRHVDLTSEKREALTKERAEELLGAADVDAVAVTLGTKSFGKESSAVAAEVLRQMKALEYADLADIIAGRPEAEALEVLKEMCGALPTSQVRVLDLSENALGEKGIRALSDILSAMSSLQEVKFMNNGLSELSIELLRECLPKSELRTLHFHNNMSGPGGARAASEIIAQCPVLEDFRMSSSRVRPDGGLPMIKALCALGPRLRRVNLSDSMFDSDCTEALVEGLSSMTNLTDLILRDTGIDKDALLDALEDPEVLPKLSVLDLSGLELDAEAGERVGALVKSRLRLRKLWMDDNELESEGAENFAAAAKPCMLELLSVQTNTIGQRGAVALARFAAATPTLTRLDLNDNTISEVGLVKVKSLLEKKGRISVLGSLDENVDDCDEDEPLSDNEDDEDENVADAGVEDDIDALADAMGQGMALK